MGVARLRAHEEMTLGRRMELCERQVLDGIIESLASGDIAHQGDS
jgi:hypothetical protein